ncbi:transposon ty3 gag-pol polyprotein [Tanacetum coccineum]|uniref:Transposon ty3 gag-pol polyprotein n=1 Tax=Tanacetum coccineum TaxID=301880 RepID=A0ABQ5AZV5_9ASTR
MHDSPHGGHSGVHATCKSIGALFYWPKLKQAVRDYVRECDTCQRCKADLASSPGLLQPLPIPTAIWEDISMDFVEGLPPSKAMDVAQVFLDNVVKLHGFPKTIVSDQDKIFVFLKLQPYRQSSVEFRTNQKLSAKFYGPYQVIAKVGQVAYTLKLPPEATIHPTFHVSLLKQHCGKVLPSPALLVSHVTSITKSPIAVLDVRTTKKHNRPFVEWLVQWSEETTAEAT